LTAVDAAARVHLRFTSGYAILARVLKGTNGVASCPRFNRVVQVEFLCLMDEGLVKEFANWGLQFNTFYGILFVKEFPKSQLQKGALAYAFF